MAGSCFFFTVGWRAVVRGGRGGVDGFILASLYAEVVSDWREGGVMGSRWINLR